MVVHRSRFPTRLEHIARGKVTSSSDEFFQILRTKEERISNGKTTKKKIFQKLENKNYNTYNKPPINTEVLLRYKNSKSRNLEYDNPKENLPFEVLSLRGELIYRKDFI